MGNAESAPQSSASSVVANKVGYHVLQVQPDSPASGIIFPFWDVIVGSQQQIFDKEDGRLIELFKTHENKPLSLLVHSLRTERVREVVIVPNSTWGGSGLVGISIRFCNFDHVLELVWRVLDVYVDSPASNAKLSSRTDFIIGTPDHIFTDSEDFFNLVSANMNKSINFYVYNALTEDVRVASITPNREWGGSGSLGCDIGYGYLHRIPVRLPTNPASPINRVSNVTSPSLSPSQHLASAPPPSSTTPNPSTPTSSVPESVNAPSAATHAAPPPIPSSPIPPQALDNSNTTPVDSELQNNISSVEASFSEVDINSNSPTTTTVATSIPTSPPPPLPQ